jgi:prefoldin subunit 5
VAYELQSREEPDIYGHAEVEQLIAEVDGYKARVREIEREIGTIHTEEQKKSS